MDGWLQVGGLINAKEVSEFSVVIAASERFSLEVG